MSSFGTWGGSSALTVYHLDLGRLVTINVLRLSVGVLGYPAVAAAELLDGTLNKAP